MDTDKRAVHDFWNAASCGETLYLQGSQAAAYSAQAATRYELEPYIPAFADFASARDRDVLEVGVGLGADHQRFAEAGARLTGVDLTERAVAHTGQRLAAFGLHSRLQTADAENLPFDTASFDIVYSWSRDLFARFSKLEIDTVLTHGDLLTSDAGQRHRGPLLTIARVLWPRWLIQTLMPKHGLFLLVRATK